MNKNRNAIFSRLQDTSKAVPRAKFSNTGLSQETNKQTSKKGKLSCVHELEALILLKCLYYPEQSTNLIQSLSIYPRHFSQTVLVAQSCLTLCNITDCSPSGFSVHGILQARILEWIAIFFSRVTPQPRDRTLISCLAGTFFTI